VITECLINLKKLIDLYGWANDTQHFISLGLPG
jgi:hypothetical protein